MKNRKGFVSNSSSSSFMGGIGVVKDWTKFNAWIELLDTHVTRKHNLPRIAKFGKWDVRDKPNSYRLTLPVNHEPEVSVKKTDVITVSDEIPDWFKAKQLLTDEDCHNIVTFEIGNNEGDSEFYKDGEVEYDIELDWFDTYQQEIYNGFGEENGIVFVDKQYGAGRNG